MARNIKYKNSLRTPLGVIAGLILAALGLALAAGITVGPAKALNAIVQTIAGAQSPAALKVTGTPPKHIWEQVGTDPLQKGLTDKSLPGFLASSRARQCAAKLHIPTEVYRSWMEQAKQARKHHSTMRYGASFDLMAFGKNCEVEDGVMYAGGPAGTWTLSTKWGNMIYTAVIPFGCGNISITIAYVPGKPAAKPVPTARVAATAYDHSNSASESHSSGPCGSANASSSAWSWARARASAVGYGDAQKRARASAYAKAASSAKSDSNVTCPSTPPSATTTVVTTTTPPSPTPQPPPTTTNSPKTTVPSPPPSTTTVTQTVPPPPPSTTTVTVTTPPPTTTNSPKTTVPEQPPTATGTDSTVTTPPATTSSSDCNPKTDPTGCTGVSPP